MAVDMTVVLVIAVLGAEDGRAERAREMVDVIFALEGRDIGPSQRPSTLLT